MVRRVSVDDIRQMNEIYYKCKSYAETARQTGWSASTVSKYIDKNYTPAAESDIKRFDKSSMPTFSTVAFETVDNLGDLCVLSDEEKEEIKELWKELVV
jgi:hypothetical protein